MSRGPIAALRDEWSVRAAFAVLAIAIGAAVGYSFADNTRVGLLVLCGLLLLGLVLHRPASIAMLAFIGTFFVQRVGSLRPGGSNGAISYSDALLMVAALMALPAVLGRREARRLQLAFLGLAAYLACLTLGVMAHPGKRAYFEWGHRLILIGGALIVGAWIAQEGLVTKALRWLLRIAVVLACFSIEYCVTHGFAAAYPLGLHKNFAGAQLAVAFVVAVVLRRQLRMATPPWAGMLTIIVLGLLATQSRGAELGTAAALLLAFLLDGRSHSRVAKVATAVVGIAIAVFAIVSVRSQLAATTESGDKVDHSSIGTRFSVEAETRKIWRQHPWTGAGLKYFLSGKYGYYAQAPNNVIDNELAESGVIGLVGFGVMQAVIIGGAFVRRRDGALVVCGTALVVGDLLHGQVDIYWSAGVVSLPFLVLGMGLAMPTGDRSGEHTNQPTSMPSTRARVLLHS